MFLKAVRSGFDPRERLNSEPKFIIANDRGGGTQTESVCLPSDVIRYHAASVSNGSMTKLPAAERGL